METSSACNAACPMCLRTLDPKFNVLTDSVSLSLDKVKEVFDVEFIKNLESMYMCGNYGDPAAAPECIDIFKYFRKVNPNIKLGLHSNGGLRSTAWWAEVGTILSRSEDYCFFGIDGLEDTNHIHRVAVNFNKVMANVTSFINSGGKAHWEFLIFAHNEHQVDDARELAKTMGFVGFREKISRRFEWVKTDLRPPIGEKHQ